MLTLKQIIAGIAFVGALITFTATADIIRYSVEYEEAKQIPLSDNPITLGVQNWGTDWARSIWTAKGKEDKYRNVFYVTANIAKPGYSGEILFSQTIPGNFWTDDTLRARIQRHRYFSKVEVEFGEYGSVDNGPAEFKYMMLKVKDKGADLSCTYFQAQWRNQQSVGTLCADSRVPALTESTVKAYLKSINFKDWFSPSGTVTLPLAGDNRG
jgi:hypothetical protein